MIRHSTLQHDLYCEDIRGNRSQAQPRQTNIYVDVEYNRVIRICLCMQQGRHETGTTGGNSLHPKQQWMESDDDERLPDTQILLVVHSYTHSVRLSSSVLFYSPRVNDLFLGLNTLFFIPAHKHPAFRPAT